jgi:hypothetical protein
VYSPISHNWATEEDSVINDTTGINQVIIAVKRQPARKNSTSIIPPDTSAKPIPVYQSIDIDSLRGHSYVLEYPDSTKNTLDSFFESLSRLSETGTLIRVLHYGDSQIEGDRISSFLRNQLQIAFGGQGVGLVPVVPVNPHSLSYRYQVSSNWERFATSDPPSRRPEHKRYGVLMDYARFSSTTRDKPGEAWITLQRSNISYPRAQQFSRCKILYGHSEKPFMVELVHGEQVTDADIVPARSAPGLLQWSTVQHPSGVTIRFSGDDSPEVYGIALDGKQGIAVDNIPLRGSSGLDFGRVDMNHLTRMYDLLNVKLVLFQFGVNVVPHVVDDYTYYENGLYRVLHMLRSRRPNLPVIVIGVSDMSRRTRGVYESFPNIPLIRNAQRRAAHRAGCVFWDMYEAMGGKNSMPSWVMADPPLASKDFTHFTPRGSAMVGRVFYNSFMSEYLRYLSNSGSNIAESKSQVE